MWSWCSRKTLQAIMEDIAFFSIVLWHSQREYKSRLKTGECRPWQETGSRSAHEILPAVRCNGQRNKVATTRLKSHTKSNQPTANHTTEKHHSSQKLRHSFEDRLHLVRIGRNPLNQKCEADSSGFVLCTAQGWFSINTQQVCTIQLQCRNQEY